MIFTKNKNLIITILILIVGTGAGFFGGMKYRDHQISKQRAFFVRGAGTRMGSARGVDGNIISIDDKGITVKLPDGSSKIVLLSDTTQINQAASATKDDLKVGITVAVFGQNE